MYREQDTHTHTHELMGATSTCSNSTRRCLAAHTVTLGGTRVCVCPPPYLAPFPHRQTPQLAAVLEVVTAVFPPSHGNTHH